jgi:hypothetical protein
MTTSLPVPFFSPVATTAKQALYAQKVLDTADIVREAMFRQPPSTPDGIIKSVVSIVQVPTQETLKHIHRIQTITIAWMSVEAALSLWAAWATRSPALTALGGDSTVELLSVTGRAVALSHSGISTHGAACCACRGWFTVRAHCLCSLGFGDVPTRVQRTKDQLLGDGGFGGGGDCHALACQREAEPDRNLKADAAESALCAYLSIIALIGLAVHAIWHIAWADPVAALLITPLICSFRGSVLKIDGSVADCKRIA